MVNHIIKYGTEDDLLKILSYHPDLNCPASVYGNYPIFVAILCRQEMVAPLIDAGASINVVNEEGYDPLTVAIMNFNDMGRRTSLEIPPMMDDEDDTWEYLGMYDLLPESLEIIHEYKVH